MADAPTQTRWWGFVALAAGLAMIVIDGTVVGVALPAMVDDLGLTITDAQWITSLYAVVFAALLLTFGHLADQHGRRLLFVGGVVLFAAASLAAAGATDPNELIVARCVQGVGGAMILPTTVSSLNVGFHGRRRSIAYGLWGAVMAGAAAVGPLFGGWLTTTWSWRSIFLINLPLAAVIVVLAVVFLPENRAEAADEGFDVLGLLTSAAGLALLVFGLIEGPNFGWFWPRQDVTTFGITWSVEGPISPVVPALVVGLALLVAFIGIESRRGRRGQAVMLNLSLFSLPRFAAGNLTAAVVAAGEFALLLVLPLYLVFACGLSVMQAGWILAAMAMGAFVSGASARRLAARMSSVRVVWLGLVIELVAAAVMAVMMTTATSPWLLTLPLAGYGLGLGLAAAQLTSTVLREVPDEWAGAAAATQSTVRQVGSAVGAAIAGTVLAVGFAVTVPAQLSTVTGVSVEDRATMVDYMTGTAGQVIAMIRDKGVDGYFGALGPQVADRLSIAFAQSAGAVVWVALGLIALGVASATRLLRHHPAAEPVAVLA
ncbi:MAG: MFS transporter [Propionibacteriales bacterium]|nr:MFS transporter [Propionibacteriales bacterium]